MDILYILHHLAIRLSFYRNPKLNYIYTLVGNTFMLYLFSECLRVLSIICDFTVFYLYRHIIQNDEMCTHVLKKRGSLPTDQTPDMYQN